MQKQWTNKPVVQLVQSGNRITRQRLQSAIIEGGDDQMILSVEAQNNKGYYNKNTGPAFSFKGGYKTWRQLANEIAERD